MQQTQVFRTTVVDDYTESFYKKLSDALNLLSQNLNDHIEAKTFVTHDVVNKTSTVHRNAIVKGIHIQLHPRTKVETTQQEHVVALFVDFTTPA